MFEDIHSTAEPPTPPPPGNITVAELLHDAWLAPETEDHCHGKRLLDKISDEFHVKDPERVEAILRLVAADRAQTIAQQIGLDIPDRNQRLGKGGFGYVFRGTDRLCLDRPVALKLLNPKWIESASGRAAARAEDTQLTGPTPPDSEPRPAAEPEQTQAAGISAHQRFEKEYDILLRESHPGLPRLYRAGAYKGQPYFVMQQGGPSLWDRKGFEQVVGDPRHVAAFAADLLDVLAYVHSRNVVHRDLKPLNVLVNRAEGQGVAPMLIDFGIMQDRRTEDGQETKPGQPPGGGNWFSDPQLANYGENARPADIFSFGRVLEYLLDPWKVRRELKADSDDRPGSTPPGTPTPAGGAGAAADQAAAAATDPVEDWLAGRLHEVAKKCVAPVDAGRYATAEEVLADVRKLLRPAAETPDTAPTPLPPPAEPAPPATSLRAQLVRHWHLIAAGLFVGGLLALLIALSLKAALKEMTAERDRLVATATSAAAECDRLAREGLVHQARAHAQDAKSAAEGYAPDKAIEAIKKAHEKGAGDKSVLKLLAETHQQLGEHYRLVGEKKQSQDEFASSIRCWNELGDAAEYRSGLALAYGCLGDVKLEGNNQGEAGDAYKESKRLRETLKKEYPQNHFYQIHYARALSNDARLKAHGGANSRNDSRRDWGAVRKELEQVRANAKMPNPQAYREATGDLAAGLLDHLSGYFAVLVNEAKENKGELPKEFEKERDEYLQLAEQLCRELRELEEPDAVVFDIALEHFRIRFGKGQPPAGGYPALLDRLQVHIDSLPSARRTWPKSLFVAIVLTTKDKAQNVYTAWETRADKHAQGLPGKDYFQSKLLDDWKGRTIAPPRAVGGPN